MRRSALTLTLALIVAACGVEPVADPGDTNAPADTTTTTSERIPTTTSPGPDNGNEEILPRCHETGLPEADPSFYRDTPKYVGNEMPVEAVRRWATQYPEFVDVWIDREHNGWVAVGFTDNTAERQTEIEETFPGDGVVAVELEWTQAELAELESRVAESLDGAVELLGTSVDSLRGYVNVVLPVLDDDALAAIRERFPDERVCVEGLEPEEVVPPGPQPEGGDGWRLLVDADEVGFPFESGIAWDQESLSSLEERIGLGELDVEVDFESEIVVWFGAVHGSSCPNLRLDDVVVDGDTIYSEIVNTDNAMACTMDAIPHTYLVAIERSVLPPAPFYVAISPEPWASRLLVEADLRPPGSTADPDQVGPDPDPPQPQPEGSGVIIETGFPWKYTVDLSCGFEAIGEINFHYWATSEPIPDSWIEAASGADSVVVEVVLHDGPEPYAEVTFHGETVVYEPTDVAGC